MVRPFGFQLVERELHLDRRDRERSVWFAADRFPSHSARNPNAGNTIQFNLTLPDGSSQTISLQATTTSPPGTGQFTIGANASATATNLQTALTSAISTLGADSVAGRFRGRCRQ